MSQQAVLKPVFIAGKYRHYKGNEYEVLDLVRHSESEEWMVLYRPLYGDSGLWVRPYGMFFEKVTLTDGQVVGRFVRL